LRHSSGFSPLLSFAARSGLLGLGSASLAAALVRFRWVFILEAFVSLGVGFKLNVVQRSSRLAQLFNWGGVVVTFATNFWWGWWRF
jgi:hypothetical protein